MDSRHWAHVGFALAFLTIAAAVFGLPL